MRKARRAALRELAPDEFEWLVHDLVHSDFSPSGLETRKMRAPDAGADSLVLEVGGRVAVAVQAKHYPTRVHWTKCEESLDAAIRAWDPAEVLFVFSSDFTAVQQTAFNRRLVGRAPSRIVRAWTLSDVERKLDEAPAIARRYLGAEATAVTEAIDRAARLGGLRLESADDLVDRARDLAEHGSELDPHFDYATYAGPMSLLGHGWPASPKAVLRSDEGGFHVEVAALARPGHDPGEQSVTFASSEEGLAALAWIHRCAGWGVLIGR